MADRRIIRIFISSPGDVEAERRRAALVIDRLSRDYARRVDLRPYLWEHEPMLASGHFQDVIEPPSGSDIMVLILWSRLGTPLPERTTRREYRGIDGRSPVTGTEWEFEEALQANHARGAPDLLVYRNRQEPPGYVSDRDRHARAVEQWARLEDFWKRHFADQGQFKTAYSDFDRIDDFTAKLERDLRAVIERRLQQPQPGGADEAASTWLGNPFRALEHYGFEHAGIFYGRGAWIERGVEQLATRAAEGTAMLLIVGASGAGKSSLAQAGILPALVTRGVVGGIGLWRHCVFRPGASGAALLDGLAAALTEPERGLPELLGPGVTAVDLARHLAGAAEDPAFPFRAALGRVEAAARAAGTLLPHEQGRLVLVIDQMEELFTGAAGIPAAERQRFVHLLGGLARSGLVYVIATLRGDFWHRAMDDVPELVTLTEGGGRLDLLAPTQAELAEMIRRPAEEAGLRFEEDTARGIRLDAELAEAAARQAGSLPLLSALLDGLYRADVERTGGRVLTYASYERLGRLDGAIARRADDMLAACFAGKAEEEVGALARMLRALATIGRSDEGAVTARTAPLSAFPAGSTERRLAEAMLAPGARLLVADRGEGEARIRVAHEALLTRWDRARQQLALDRRDLETRTRVEQAVALWRGADPAVRNRRLLRDLALAEAEDLLARWGGDIDADTATFIRLSAGAARRRRIATRLAVAAAILVFAVIAGWAEYQRGSAEEKTALAQAAERQAVAARAEAEEAGRQARQSEEAAVEALERAGEAEQKARRNEEKALALVMSDALLWTAESLPDSLPGLFLRLDVDSGYTDAERLIEAVPEDGSVVLRHGRAAGAEAVRRLLGHPATRQAPMILRPVADARYVLLFLESDRHTQNRSFTTWTALTLYDRRQGVVIARIAAGKVGDGTCYFATPERLADEMTDWTIGGSAVHAGSTGGHHWAGFIDASGWGAAYLECRPAYVGINYGFGGTAEGLLLFRLPVRNEAYAPEPAPPGPADDYHAYRCFIPPPADPEGGHIPEGMRCDGERDAFHRERLLPVEPAGGSEIIPRLLVSTETPGFHVVAEPEDLDPCTILVRRPNREGRFPLPGFNCESLWEPLSLGMRETVLRIASDLAGMVFLSEGGGSGGWRRRLYLIPFDGRRESIACTMGSGEQSFALVGHFLVAKCYQRDLGRFGSYPDSGLHVDPGEIRDSRTNIIVVLDLLRQRVAHELAVPDSRDFDLVSGVALSPAGDRLALLSRPKDARRMVTLRHLPTGRILAEHRFAMPLDLPHPSYKLAMEVTAKAVHLRMSEIHTAGDETAPPLRHLVLPDTGR